MATNNFRGDAPAVAQINSVTPANVNIGNTFLVTINGKSITVTATDTLVATVTALLAAAITNTTIAEFLEVVAVDNTTNVLLTANIAGKPFTQTSSAVGGTATNITATPTASSGPEDWSTAANWTDGVPNAADDVYIDNTSTNILYGLAQSGVALTSINIGANYTGNIGLPLVNESGYYEYRPNRLAIGAATVNIGKGVGSGSARIRLDLGASATAINVYSTGAGADVYGAVDIKGSGSVYTCNLFKGSVAFATEPDQVATLIVNQGYLTNQAGDVSLYLGSGVTLTTMVQSGGDVLMFCGFTTYSITGGLMTIVGTGTGTTLTVDSGTVVDRSSGTLTTLKVGGGGSYDRSEDQRPKTITNSTIEAGSKFLDPNKTITFTNPMLINRTGGVLVGEFTIDLGTNFSIQRS